MTQPVPASTHPPSQTASAYPTHRSAATKKRHATHPTTSCETSGSAYVELLATALTNAELLLMIDSYVDATRHGYDEPLTDDLKLWIANGTDLEDFTID